MNLDDMTFEQRCLMAQAAGLRALIEELHASGHVDRERVASRETSQPPVSYALPEFQR